MIYPTIDQLTEGKFNRYELVIGVLFKLTFFRLHI